MVKQAALVFQKTKTELLNDCRKGKVIFRLLSHTDTEVGEPYENERFRKPSKVETYKLHFGRSSVALPKDRSRLSYTDKNLILYDETGAIKLAYEVRNAKY